MKKSVKILAGISAFVLIGGILWFANGFLGNPISKIIANHTAKKYVTENYSNMQLEVSDASYNFKTGYYHVQVKSPISKDTYFSISISPLGKVQYDSYEENVIKKFNTYTRLNESYWTKIKDIFEDKEFPYKSDICFGELKEKSLENLSDEYTEFGPIYGLNLSELELDKNYNVNELSKSSGHIVFYAIDDDVSIKKASEILLDIKNILDSQNISFYAIDFTLKKAISDSKSIDVREFLYSDIYEENLENRIKKASDELKEYNKKQDEIKKEMDKNN